MVLNDNFRHSKVMNCAPEMIMLTYKWQLFYNAYLSLDCNGDIFILPPNNIRIIIF